MKKNKWVVVLMSALTGVAKVNFQSDYMDEGYDDYFWDTSSESIKNVKCIACKKSIEKDAV